VRTYPIIIAALMVAVVARSAGAGDPVPAQPDVVRGGLPNVSAKLHANQPIAVVFLGGSVTRGGGERGFAALVPQWIQSQFPQSPVTAINAGIMDTDSAFGAARLQRDVLAHNPDLLFVEFSAVRGEEDRLADVERLVRRGWTANPKLDVVFLYAMSSHQYDAYVAGLLPEGAQSHDKVAAHYSIPSIAMALEPAARMKQGRNWREMFRDERVPTTGTYTIYTECITSAMDRLLDAGKPGPRAMPIPLTPDLDLEPEPATAQPQPKAQPLVTRDGAAALITYEMPAPGLHWIGQPHFNSGVPGADLWRLGWQSTFANGKRLNAAFSLDRSAWGGPMQWFDEYRFFHGPAGIPLARFRDGDGVQLSAREDDLPIVTFVAPRTGRYVFSATSAGLNFWGLHSAIAMNIVHFPAGSDKGTSIAVHRTERGHDMDLRLEEQVQMNEGDELAFCVDANASAVGGGAMYRNVVIKVGYFRK
jgi:hypothetical protein